MIENAEQREVTMQSMQKLQKELDKAKNDAANKIPEWLTKGYQESIRSQIADLQLEIDQYDKEQAS